MVESISPTAMAASIKLAEPAKGAPGIFADLDALKLSLEDAGMAGSTEVLTRVPVRKPTKDEYFRIRPGDENTFTTMIYEDRTKREFYFVTPAMIPIMRSASDVTVATLVQFMTKQNVVGIFPLKVATDSSGPNGWQDTARHAAQLAKTDWIRIKADMALGGYRIYKAEGDLGEPKWSDMSFNELLDLAFKDRVIASADHPVLNNLFGRY